MPIYCGFTQGKLQAVRQYVQSSNGGQFIRLKYSQNHACRHTEVQNK